jgi:hypothetical protein
MFFGQLSNWQLFETPLLYVVRLLVASGQVFHLDTD